MNTNEPEFIASYWTLAGNVVPLGPPEEEASPHDLRDRLAVAAAAGYSGVGLMHSDLMASLRRYSATEIRAMLDETGLRYLELEFLVGWLEDGEPLAASEAVLADMLEAARSIGVKHLKIGPDMEAYPWPMAHMIERFASLCERAEAAGTSIVLEPMPWSNVATLATAIEIVEGANKTNGGFLIDIWHMARGGIVFDAVAEIPSGLVHHVELNDADLKVRGSLLEDTLNHRRYCGDGALDVPGFLRALQTQGYGGPYGIEILSERERERPYDAVANDALRTAKREFAKI